MRIVLEVGSTGLFSLLFLVIQVDSTFTHRMNWDPVNDVSSVITEHGHRDSQASIDNLSGRNQPTFVICTAPLGKFDIKDDKRARNVDCVF